jgi:transaldolase
MKIFLDTADLKDIRRAAEAGLIDGVTTNPTLLARASGGRDAKEIFREIAEMVDGPVSAEVVGSTPPPCWKKAGGWRRCTRTSSSRCPSPKTG